VIGEALLDEMRLKGSRIENNEDFLAKLHQCVTAIDPESYLYLTPRTSSPSGGPGGGTNSQATTSQASSRSQAQARVVLRTIRQAINGYRDDRRAALVRARNRLVWTGTITGVAAFAMLVLAVLVQVRPAAIVAAVVFYLIGAVVGLFNQLRRESRATSAIEDFGLSRARLFYAPLLSGLAGIGGVLVTALLYGALNGPIISYPAEAFVTAQTATPVATAVGTTGAGAPPSDAGEASNDDEDRDVSRIPALRSVFDLDANRSGLLLAAVFGLTPDLLVDRLQNRANRFKADLQSSTAQERGGRETPE
jgi:hypothetical protein